MKKYICSIAIIASSLLFNIANAQVNVCVWCAVNIAVQPTWGPVGYDYVTYYYLPDIDAYYNVPQHEFIYRKRGAWKTKASLPARYATFNLYHAYKVVLNDEEPYLQREANRTKYISFKGQHDQVAIRDSHGPTRTNAKEGTENYKSKMSGKSQGQHNDEDHRIAIAQK